MRETSEKRGKNKDKLNTKEWKAEKSEEYKKTAENIRYENTLSAENTAENISMFLMLKESFSEFTPS